MRRALFWAVCGACAAPVDIVIDRVDPASATNTDVVPIRIEGSGFRLAVLSDVDDGMTSVGQVGLELDDVVIDAPAWRDDQLVEASVPAGLPVGLYDVTLEIRGHSGVLVDGYEVVDPMAAGCLASWMNGPTITSVMPVASVNTATLDEGDPFVTRDELELYFVRNGDLWHATRSSPTVAFGAPSLDPVSDVMADDTKLSVTSDGLTAYFNTARDPTAGGSDIWRGTRASVADPFMLDKVGLAAVNDAGNQWDAHISGDGLRMYFAPEDTSAVQHIAVATRATTADPFGAPQFLPELIAARDNDPTLSLDERVIVFASNRGDGVRRLWYAVRAVRTDPFGPAMPLPGMDGCDGGHLSSDGCTLYFVTSRNGSPDIYVASVQ